MVDLVFVSLVDSGFSLLIVVGSLEVNSLLRVLQGRTVLRRSGPRRPAARGGTAENTPRAA